MESDVLPAATLAAPPHNRSRIIGSIIAILLVLAVITGAFFTYDVYAREKASEAWAALTMPSELSSAVFVSATPRKSVFYERTLIGFNERYPVAGMRNSVTRAGDRIASIVRTEDKSPLSLELDGKEIAKLSPAATALAMSPNGTRFAFQTPHSATSSTSSWDIAFFDKDTSEVRTVTGGFAPFFISDEEVASFSPDGATSRAFSDTSASGTPRASVYPSSTIQDIAQSPDKTLVAWSDPAAKQIQVYRVTDTGMTPVFSMKSTVHSIALSNDRLYLLVPVDSTGADVWSYPLDTATAGSKIHHLPASLRITRMVF